MLWELELTIIEKLYAIIDNFYSTSLFFCLRIIQRLRWKFLLAEFGKKTYIFSPLRIDGPENISVGSKVYVGYKTWLAALPLTGEKQCSLIIKDDCAIGNFNHIYCTKQIILEKGVSTTDKVYISDNLYSYKDIHTYIKD